jgi:hypothetical protein
MANQKSKTMNLTELKATAFDAIRQVEIWQKRVQELNQAIIQAEVEQANADKGKLEAAKEENVETTKKALYEKASPNKPAK